MGVDLGRFLVAYKSENLNLGEPQYSFQIKALDPNPSKEDGNYFHPHIKNETLCTGEFGPLLKTALHEARLLSCFQLIEQSLAIYNRHSPFKKMCNWTKSTCGRCGDGTLNTVECNICGAGNICDHCKGVCVFCESLRKTSPATMEPNEAVCISCLNSCLDCGHQMCPDHAVKCPQCGGVICLTCAGENIAEKCTFCISNS